MKDLGIEFGNEIISKKTYDEFIKKYNLNITNNYWVFISKNNGGVPDLSNYNEECEISLFYAVSLKKKFELDTPNTILSSLDVIYYNQLKGTELPKHLYPFGQDAGGSAYCISMQENDYGAIYKFYWDGSNMRFVCNSFEEFIDGLA